MHKGSFASDCQFPQVSFPLSTHLHVQNEIVYLLSTHEMPQLLQHLLALVVNRGEGLQ